jgi:hypothetical protein
MMELVKERGEGRIMMCGISILRSLILYENKNALLFSLCIVELQPRTF